MRIIRSTIPTEWKNFYERIRFLWTRKNRQAGKRELFLTGAVLLTALRFLSREPGLPLRTRQRIPGKFTVDGTVVETLELHKDQEYTVKNDQGGVNVFVIRDGKAWVTEASCPDKICMDQGQVSQEGEMIVCLPNRMTARVMGAP